MDDIDFDVVTITKLEPTVVVEEEEEEDKEWEEGDTTYPWPPCPSCGKDCAVVVRGDRVYMSYYSFRMTETNTDGSCEEDYEEEDDREQIYSNTSPIECANCGEDRADNLSFDGNKVTYDG